jgi:putative tricarboxylic transport membrane protein
LIGLTVGFILLVEPLGFLVTGAALLFLLVLLLWRRPVAAAVVAIVGTVATQQSFAELLLVPLPWGLLEPWSAVLTWR